MKALVPARPMRGDARRLERNQDKPSVLQFAEM